MLLCISTDKISFPENLDDSFQQGLLSNMESTSENTIKTDHLPLSQELPKPQALVEESEKPKFAANSRSNYNSEGKIETPKQKFKILETPLLENISQTCKLGSSFIPETSQCHQERRGLPSSTMPERLFFCKTPVAQVDNKEKQIRLRWVRIYGKTNEYVHVVPETPKLNLKSTDELSLYD